MIHRYFRPFLMLANPTPFEPALAIAYSAMAALKFSMFTFAYLAAFGGLVTALYFWAVQTRRGADAA